MPKKLKNDKENKIDNNKIKIGFWGVPEYSIITLDWLEMAGYDISFIVTTPDKPKGRKLILTPPPVKSWATEHNIPVLQPEKLRDSAFIEEIKKYDCDVFIVMAYGKIIPEEILNIPKAKSLNIHPSLLPKYRGSCPIESAILADDQNTGSTIIRMDKEMDHGPIIWQKEYISAFWPPKSEELGEELVDIASNAIVLLLPEWIAGKIPEIEQDHTKATFTKKIEKEDGLINLADDPYKNFLKIQAYHDWPSAYFFVHKKGGAYGEMTRIKITEAEFENGELKIKKVIPEGRSEMDYHDFTQK